MAAVVVGVAMVIVSLVIAEGDAAVTWLAGGRGTMASGATLMAAADQPVSLSGWLHVIWNGQPHFVLISDQGVATQLVVDEALIKTCGGARRLNQQRVTVTGERSSHAPGALRVRSITLEAEHGK